MNRFLLNMARIVLPLTALAIVASAHAYLVDRWLVEPGWPEPWPTLGTALIALLFVAGITQPVWDRVLAPPLLRLASWPIQLWVGAFFVGLWVTLASDLLFGLLGAAGTPGAADPARLRVAGIAVVLALAFAVGLPGALRIPEVRRIEFRLARWPAALDGFRIVQISDIHIGPLLGRRFAAGLVERVNGLKPDLVAVTGDLVDGNAERLREDTEPFASLAARHGVFFITGNHDFYSDADAWCARTQELGMRVLRNERVAIERDGAVFDLAGVDDYRGDWRHGSTQDLPAALAGRDDQRALVLLAHDPATFREASASGVDLQLSGHTHGGQIWPFHHFVRMAGPWVAGPYTVGSGQLYVSRGSGFWGPPLRLFAPSEVTEITIRADGQAVRARA